VSFLRKQESRLLGPQKSTSPGLAFDQAGLSTARGEAGCFIRRKCYAERRNTICYSCVSRNPECFVPARRDKGGSGNVLPSLDSHFRGNDTLVCGSWTEAVASFG